MNRKIVSILAASSAFCAVNAYAAVSVSFVDTAATSAWASSFGGGDLAFSLSATAPGNAVAMTIDTGNYIRFAQSFRGNGQVLQGWGFYGNGNNGSPVDYTISLIDYGTAGPIDTAAEFSPGTPAPVLFTDTFSLASLTARQIYFDFTSGSNFTLQSDRYYAMAITASAGQAFMVRLSGGDSTYANGTGAVGTASLFLNPDAFAGAGALRDTVFALYTGAAAVPEPSSFAALAGVVALGFGASRRRRPAC